MVMDRTLFLFNISDTRAREPIRGIKEEFFNPHGLGLNKLLKIDFCIEENSGIIK